MPHPGAADAGRSTLGHPMTHEYTLLLGATVLPGGGAPACGALAWAAGTILAVGSEAEVRAISRGDSCVMEARGRFVVPLGAPLEIGAAADMLVLEGDPRLPGDPRLHAGPAQVAVIRGGHVVEGSLEPPAVRPAKGHAVSRAARRAPLGRAPGPGRDGRSP